ncbi:fungal-specific transcription factor domain-containing protein [Cantharellus anzutake]|uniref:fungal-specific transcription factor domain-containing protein n=1 Tax=Cantharellus anzutake TaxID=1750568 RepID=UPI0019080687|nr:fungal-specific transcription factor domain-containing protein [Cantharellus anzutake]KAF8341422.1 fungal-specific transcription factor domain-containing protein [Cantharellus anzutake]
MPKAPSYGVQTHLETSSLDEAAVAAERLRRLVSECGVQPHKVEELIRDLPPKSFADDLIDYYFEEINFTRYPIFESAFRTSYEALVSKAHRPHALDVVFLPLVFVVLAISVHLAPDTLVGDAKQRRLTSQRYYWSARRSMLIAASIGESLELVIARLLAARYLTIIRRIVESWNVLGTAVRTGMSLGLHRDGTKLGLDPFQTEYRRRVWAYLYHADRAYALVLGRPHSIQDDFCDTLPPSNTDDSFLSSQSIVLPKDPPLSQPTVMTFVVLRHALSRIIGHIVSHFQQVKPTHYSDVLGLDDELQRFIRTLPPHYSLNPDKSLDETHRFIPVHRFLIVSEVFFIRISLHRPYMLRKLDSDRFAFSRRACFDSAISDFAVRQDFRQHVPASVIKRVRGGYREFQSAMIAGIYLALEPHGSDASTMHKILDTFLSNYVSDPDETTIRELKIIELLKNKSLSVAAGGPIQSPVPRKATPLPSEKGATSGSGSWPTAPQTPTSVATSTTVGHDGPPEASILLELGQPRQSLTNSPDTRTMAMTPASLAQAASATSPRSSWPPRPTTAVRISSQTEASFRYTTAPDISNGSPLDEEESAQRLLDHWVNNAQVDSVGGGSFGIGSFDVSNILPSAWSTTRDIDGDGSLGPFSQSDSLDASGASPSGIGDAHADYSYWENLVEHIRASGGIS